MSAPLPTGVQAINEVKPKNKPMEQIELQNRYFGDVGDFGKYGLLRKICGITSGGTELSLGVVWYLVPDEGHNNDGKHVSYLDKSEAYCPCDPKLFKSLKNWVESAQRAVIKIQNSDLLPYDTAYHDECLTYENVTENKARLDHRCAWLCKAKNEIQESDVVFLDPDNGFEVKSYKKHHKKGGQVYFLG